MRPRIDQPVHFLRAVVDGVEAPQERDFVRPAVPPIETHLSHHQRRPEAHSQRKCRRARLHTARDHEVQSPTDGRHRYNQQQLGQQPAKKIVAQVRGKPRAKYVLPVQREDSLQRHKNRHEQRQPDAQTEEIHGEGKELPRNRAENLHAARSVASAACEWRTNPPVRDPKPLRKWRRVPERPWKVAKPHPAGKPAELPRECPQPGM